MSQLCAACEVEDAPTERGVLLCRGCTRVLLAQLRNPSVGEARVLRAASYAQCCGLCGEWADRIILEHPRWGNVCDVDITAAAELHGVELQ